MGAYVSTAQCAALLPEPLNCTVTNATAERPYRIIGGIDHRGFEPNADIAGIGVLYAFFAVASLALITSAIYLILQLTKFMKFTGVNTVVRQRREASLTGSRVSYRTTWADIFEAIILSCSDQQLFTSGAYALTLRYVQGCKISAYHYNIVANMLLITCATHLMSVTVVSQYWRHKLLAVVRILLISGLYIVTLVLLSNQNAGLELQWPVDLPLNGENDTLLILPAACFQSNGSSVDKTLKATFGRGASLAGTFTLNNRIVGWNFFILMVLWYGAAMIAELFRFWVHHYNPPQKSLRVFRVGGRWAGRVFWFYQFVGATFSAIAIVSSYKYIQDLRRWMDQSPWLKKENGVNPENEATSFGQLVPLLLILVTVFMLLQLIGDKFSGQGRNRSQDAGPDTESLQSSSSFQKSFSHELPEGKDTATFRSSGSFRKPFSQGLPEKKDAATFRSTSPSQKPFSQGPPEKKDAATFRSSSPSQKPFSQDHPEKETPTLRSSSPFQKPFSQGLPEEKDTATLRSSSPSQKPFSQDLPEKKNTTTSQKTTLPPTPVSEPNEPKPQAASPKPPSRPATPATSLRPPTPQAAAVTPQERPSYTIAGTLVRASHSRTPSAVTPAVPPKD